jgi:hypothetical protein
MRKHIVYTRHDDGGVSICCPSDWIISVMSCGGLWDEHPPGFADVQIARMVADGIREDAAARYARAVQRGGCTTAEALGIIRDRDCAHLGTAIELWDIEHVPTDRWFRNAWRRSHNGGPISVDLKLARPIQLAHVRHAIAAENARREADFDMPPFIEVDLRAIRQHILEARDEQELRHVWPRELMQ